MELPPDVLARIRVREALRPGAQSDTLESLESLGQSSVASQTDIPSRSLPWSSKVEAIVVEVATRYRVKGCAFVIEGQCGKLIFAASAGLDLEEVAQDGRKRGERGLFRHHTGRHAPVLIEDLLTVDFFKDDPLVQLAPHLRFYVATPVICDGQHHLGVLAIYDDNLRLKRFGFKSCNFLEQMAGEVASLMSLCGEAAH